MILFGIHDVFTYYILGKGVSRGPGQVFCCRFTPFCLNSTLPTCLDPIITPFERPCGQPTWSFKREIEPTASQIVLSYLVQSSHSYLISPTFPSDSKRPERRGKNEETRTTFMEVKWYKDNLVTKDKG